MQLSHCKNGIRYSSHPLQWTGGSTGDLRDLRVKDIARFGLKTGEMQTSDKSRENDKD